MNRTNSRTWQALRPFGDAAVALVAFYVAFLLRIHLPLPFTTGLMPADRLRFFASELGAVLVSQLLILYFFGFYDPPVQRWRPELVKRLVVATGLQGLALMGFYFLFERTFPRSVLLLFVGLNFVLLFGWRHLLTKLFRPPLRRVAVVGSGPAALELARAVGTQTWQGLSIVGYVPAPEDPRPAADDHELLGPCLGTVADLPAMLADGRLDDIILTASNETWQTRLIDRLAGTRPAHSNVLLLPGPFESLIGRMRYRWVQDIPLIEVVRESEWRINRPLKRLLDVVGATLLLLLFLPVMAVCALAVRLTSPGPIVYAQRRVGRNHQPFTLWKFRTMRRDAESETGETLASPNDPRLTTIGASLRRWRLDELPQLFNVLGGSMSLVGPRPERPGFVRQNLKEIPGYAERFSLAPGLTGLAQVNGDYYSSAQNKLRYDLAYMANWNVWLDLAILLRTVKIVLTSRGT